MAPKKTLLYNELMGHFLHLQIILGNFLSFLVVTHMYWLKKTQEGVSRKTLLQNLNKKKGKEWKIDNEKNIEKPLRSRLLDFLLFHIKGNLK